MANLNENIFRALMNDLQETDTVTKEILSWTGEIYTLSWKFPNHRSDTIEPVKLLEEYAGPSEERYLYAVELLIDRLNFFQRVFVAFLDLFPTTSGKCHIPPNVSAPLFMGSGALIHEMWEKTKQIYYALCKRMENDIRNDMVGKGDYDSKTTPVSIDVNVKGSQTSLASLNQCENCQISTNIIKTMMDSLERVLKEINGSDQSKTKENLPPSEITQYRERMGPEMSKITQWGAMSHLAEAINADLRTLQDAVGKCFSELCSMRKAKKFQETRVANLERKKQKLLKFVDNEKINESKLMESKTELENLLRKKHAEITFLSEQLDELRASNNKLRKENEELDANLMSIQQDLVTAGEELEMKTNEVCIYKQKYKAEMSNRKHAQQETQATRVDVENLEEQLILIRRNAEVLEEEWVKERTVMMAEADALQRNLDVIKDEKDDLTNVMQLVKEELNDSVNEIQNLKNELKNIIEEKIMLIKYPDLHGPVESELIGIPDLDMQGQIKANNIRIKLLSDENSALQKTIEKFQKKYQKTEISNNMSTLQN